MASSPIFPVLLVFALDFDFMRSSVFGCGRVAFARGNNSWARQFNQTLQAARGFNNVSSPIAPSAWRMLSSSSPIFVNKINVLLASTEVPVGPGFAEQFGSSQSGMSCFAPSGDDEVTESGDEVAEALSAVPATTNASLIKSLSDVIVFGTNGSPCNKMRYAGHEAYI